MGYIGNEIVQSRKYVDPNPPAPPSMNYKYTFPITVYDAVRRSMDNADSVTLTEDIDNIYKELRSKQPMIPSLPASYIVTYGGRAGAVGSIRITESISWDPTKWRNDKIPTEKAVGDLLFRYGILDQDPDTGSDLKKIIWSDIVGRPTIYDDLGDDEEGVISQKGMTKIINEIKNDMIANNNDIIEKMAVISLDLKDHIENKNNPHEVTLDQIGGASKSDLDKHLMDFNNPHNVTLETLGIPNVDNTSDKDKPISDATQEALDRINQMLDGINGSMGLMNFVTRIEYNQRTGRLDAIYQDGSRLGVTIVTDGLVDEIQFDPKTHELKVIELSGKTTKIPLDVLYNKYIGSEGTHIIIEIDDDNVVKATIIPKSITSDEIADKSIKTNVIANEAVTGDKIKDCTITTIKYANHSVTSEKIAKSGVEEVNIKDRAVTEKKLFTSTVDNRVLAVRTANTNPQWTQIVGDMIAKEVIGTRHLIDESVTENKLSEYAVTETRIHDAAVTTRKLGDKAVTTDKLDDDSVTSEKIIKDILLRGIPRAENRPDITADDNEIVDAGWVKEVLSKNAVTEENIGRRVINGKHLFSSNIKNRALIVTEVDGDPYWGQINHEMLEDSSVETINIKDLAITPEKILDEAIQSRHLGRAVIKSIHIIDGEVVSEKIFTSSEANRVLAALTEDGHPMYTQVLEDMLSNASVTTSKIADQSVTLSKIAREADPNTVLAFTLKDHDPQWMKVKTELIENKAVTSSKLYPSENPNMVLAVRDPNTSAYYMKINGEMMEDKVIEERHLTDNAVKGNHIADKAIEARHMGDGSVENSALATGAVDGRVLFKTHRSFQVLAVKSDPHADAEWTQVTTEMIERMAITPDKLFTSNYNNRVLAVTEAGGEPEYVLLTGAFIRDKSIGSAKLMDNLTLYGSPSIGEHPSDNSNDHTVADTFWVKKIIENALEDYTPTGSILNIPDQSVTGEKLFTTEEAPRVLGVDTPNGTPKYLQVITDMIRNGAVTNTKIERDVKLLGSPSIEVRPGPTYSDKTGFGNVIPDCQWVLDRILDDRKDFYNELKEKICCLKDIDPMKVRHDQIIIAPIATEAIPVMAEAVMNGKRVPVGDTDPIEIDGETFEPIPYHRLRDIIMNSAEPHESKIMSFDSNYVEAIPYYRIKGLADESVIPNVSGDGFEIDLETLNSQLGCCDCQDDWNSKSFVVPITTRVVRQIINGTAEAVSTRSIDVYGNTIEPIPSSTIEDITSGRVVLTHGLDPVDINGETLEPIKIDRLRGLITGEIHPELSVPLDITEYEEEREKDTELKPGVIITEYLQDRSVTGAKLFTTPDPDCILGVIEGNSDPVWTKVNTNMMEDKSVTGSKIFTSNEDNRILGVLEAGDDPIWLQINEHMLGDECVDTRHIRDNAITTSKIIDYAITAAKLARQKMIETIHLFDYAVTNRKIADLAITNAKIADHTIEGIKLARRTEIPAYTYVEEHRDYERRALRNTILSPRTPEGGHNGDIWLQFA